MPFVTVSAIARSMHRLLGFSTVEPLGTIEPQQTMHQPSNCGCRYKCNFPPSSTKCDDIKLAVVSLPVKMPNGTIIHSTHTGLIPNDSIPLAAHRAHLFKELYQALISIGVFCDIGCMALFDDAQVVIFNKETKEILMRGPRNTLTGLYMIDLEQNIKQPKIMKELEIPDTYFDNHVYECRSKHNLAIYYHLTLFSPPIST